MKKFLLLALTAYAWAGDVQHGSTVVRDQGCLECHTVNAQGSGHEANATAPDFAVNSVSAYTPSAFASALWNHTPAMWREISAKSVPLPALAEAEWGGRIRVSVLGTNLPVPRSDEARERGLQFERMRRLPFPCYAKPRSGAARFRLEERG